MKYAKDISDEYKNLIREYVERANLHNVVDVVPVRMVKSNGSVVEVVKANEVAAYFAGDGVVLVGVFEEVLDNFTEDKKRMLIEDAVMKILFDWEKDKLSVNKGEITLTLDSYHKWGKDIVDTLESAYLSVQQYNEEEKERKKAAKSK